MLCKLIEQSQMQHRLDCTGGMQGFTDSTSSTAHDGPLLHRDECIVVSSNFQEQFSIKWLGPAHVDHRCIEFFGCLQGRIQKCAESQNSNAFAHTADFCFGKRQRLQISLRLNTGTSTTWIANRYRVVLLKCAAQQHPALAFIGRTGNAQIRYTPHKRNVVRASVGGSIGTHQTSTIQCKHHREVLQRHIVNQLVITALQKRRVNRHHGL